MSPQSAALVESVAQALSWAINDPVGHSSWNETLVTRRPSGVPNSSAKRRRNVEETKQAATVFDSSAIPPISIDKYLMRLCATFRCSDATFIAALIVVDRLLEYDGGRLPLTMRNVHRVFLASLVVATKYHEDLVYSNSHYAKAGGVQLKEVNRLERALLAALDFDLKIEPEQYRQYETNLLNLCISPHMSGGRAEPRATESNGDSTKPSSNGYCSVEKGTDPQILSTALISSSLKTPWPAADNFKAQHVSGEQHIKSMASTGAQVPGTILGFVVVAAGEARRHGRHAKSTGRDAWRPV